jgi:PAS domain S-box-containing protein
MEDTETSDTRSENQTDRYRTIVEESNDVATIIDTDETMTYVSPAVIRVFGYDPEELAESRVMQVSSLAWM